MSLKSKFADFSRMRVPARLFLAALIVFFIVRLYLAAKPHVVFWDEAVYIGMGKYLYSFGAVGLWEILRPVFLPVILGFIWKISGNSLFYMEIVMLLFSLGYILTSYLLAKELFGREAAAFAGLTLLLTPVFFLNSGFILTDITSGFFILVSLLFLVKGRVTIAGFFGSIAFLTKFPQALILLGVGAALFYPKKRINDLLKYLIGFSVPTLVFMVFNYFIYKDSTNFFFALIRPLIYGAGHQANPFAPTGNIFFYLFNLVGDNFLLVFAIFGFILYLTKRLYSKLNLNLVFFSLVAYIIYFSMVPNKQLRFGLLFLGLIVVLAGYGLNWLFNKSKAVAISLIILAVYLSISADIAYAGWRHETEPEIVTEFYTYFSQKTVNDAILTSDPVPAAYSNELFIPYYFSVREGLKILSDESHNASAIIYTPRSLPCQETDDTCKETREIILKVITKNKLVFNESYYGEEYFIYLNTFLRK